MTTINTGWLKNNKGEKFAPKTLASQVVTQDGKPFDKSIEDGYATKEEVQQLSEEIDDQNEKIAQIETSIGDVSVVLDTVITMQEQYIGGAS